MTDFINNVMPFVVFLIGVAFLMVGVLLTVRARREVKPYRVNEITKRQLRQVIRDIDYTLKTIDETQQSISSIAQTIRLKTATDFIEKGGEQEHDS